MSLLELLLLECFVLKFALLTQIEKLDRVVDQSLFDFEVEWGVGRKAGGVVDFEDPGL